MGIDRKLIALTAAGAILVVGLLWLSLAAVPPAEPRQVVLDDVVAPAPLTASDFPEELPVGAAYNGRRKPDPDAPPLRALSNQELQAWQADIRADFAAAESACGASVPTTCSSHACVVVGSWGAAQVLESMVRRPMSTLERMAVGLGAPKELDRCTVTADQIYMHRFQYYGRPNGLACHAFTPRIKGVDPALSDAHAGALCARL